MRLGSPIRKEVNAALLKLQVAGEMDSLEKTWFESAGE